MARLVVKSGAHRGMSFMLAGERVSLGRDFTNHVQVADSKASRHHAEIRAEEPGWVIWDLGSSNGTYVNRRQVKNRALRPGDQIMIGQTIIEFSADDRPAEDAPRLECDSTTSEFERYDTLADRNPLFRAAEAVDVESLQRSNARLVRLYELARAAADSDSVNELFARAGAIIERALEADRVFGVLLDDRGRWTPLGADPGAKGSGRAARLAAGAPMSMTVVETVRRESKSVMSRTAEDARFRESPSVKMNRIGSVVCVPLLAREDFLGALYADRIAGGEDFTREDVEFMDAAASYAALAVEALRSRETMGRRVESLVRELRGAHCLVGESERMQAVYRFIERAGPVDSGVLILGESGTGKELVARAVHHNSRRSDGPFEVVNCAALTDSLVESELFGHARGAFTGATADRPGRFELADKGTIFLDEIGELPESMQTKLLRVLEQGESVRVGEAEVRSVDVRVVAATNRNLDREVAEGRFRGDLFYRLNILRVEMPPLRERGADIDLLIDHYLREYAVRMGRPRLALTTEARDRFRRHRWPGNVRELRNALERIAVLSPVDSVGPDDLPPGIFHAPGARSEAIDLGAVEREHIMRVLDSVSGNKKRAAELLGIDRSTLYAKLKSFGIETGR